LYTIIIALSSQGMFANTRFSHEHCWQTLLSLLRGIVCKYLTRTAPEECDWDRFFARSSQNYLIHCVCWGYSLPST
jgi:hypothetical protein